MLLQYSALLLGPYCWGVRRLALDTKLLPADFAAAVDRISYDSASLKINVALSELPDFKAVPGIQAGPHHIFFQGIGRARPYPQIFNLGAQILGQTIFNTGASGETSVPLGFRCAGHNAGIAGKANSLAKAGNKNWASRACLRRVNC